MSESGESAWPVRRSGWMCGYLYLGWMGHSAQRDGNFNMANEHLVAEKPPILLYPE